MKEAVCQEQYRYLELVECAQLQAGLFQLLPGVCQLLDQARRTALGGCQQGMARHRTLQHTSHYIATTLHTAH